MQNEGINKVLSYRGFRQYCYLHSEFIIDRRSAGPGTALMSLSTDNCSGFSCTWCNNQTTRLKLFLRMNRCFAQASASSRSLPVGWVELVIKQPQTRSSVSSVVTAVARSLLCCSSWGKYLSLQIFSTTHTSGAARSNLTGRWRVGPG